MRLTLLIISVLILSCSFNANSQSCDNGRYLNEVFADDSVISNIHYATARGYASLFDTDLHLDIYVPKGDTLSKRPLIVHGFGGAYLIGDKIQPNVPEFGEMYAKRGFVFVSYNYRKGFNPVSGQSAERAVIRAAQDLRAALRYLADFHAVYGIDTNNITLTGTSAGSISALMQTFMDEHEVPSSRSGIFLEPLDLGCIDCAGNNNHGNKEVKIHAIINNWGAMLDSTLIDKSNPDEDIPVISFHGDNDNAVPYTSGNPFSYPIFPSVDGSYLIHQRMDNENIANELVPLVGKGHEPQLLDGDVTDTIVQNGCRFIYDEILRPTTSAIIGDVTACDGDVKTYSVDLHSNTRYCWAVTGGTIISESANTISVEWNTIGTGSIMVQESNCIDATSNWVNLRVEVYAIPSAVFSYADDEGDVAFTNTSVNGLSWHWNFGDGNTDAAYAPNHTYADTGVYQVMLIADNNGCADTSWQSIHITFCPMAAFSYTSSVATVNFTDATQYADSRHWNFGDGNTSTMINPSNTYAANGAYTIQLIAYNNTKGCNDTIEQQVAIMGVGIESISESNFSIYPNPIEDKLTIELIEPQSGAISIEVYNSNGQLVIVETIANGASSHTIKTSTLAKGVYEVQVKTAEAVYSTKVVKQ